MLEDEYGVKPSDIHWIRGGLEQAGPRREDRDHAAARGAGSMPRRKARRSTRMLEAGEIDAFIGPRTPSCFEQGTPNIGWLCPDPMAAAKDYFTQDRHLPDHAHDRRAPHAGRRSIRGCRPRCSRPSRSAKAICLALLEETSASKVTLPFMEEQVKAARDLMGADFWPYGIPANRKQLEYFLAQHHSAGTCRRGSSTSRNCSTRRRSRRTSCNRVTSSSSWAPRSATGSRRMAANAACGHRSRLAAPA